VPTALSLLFPVNGGIKINPVEIPCYSLL